MREDSDVTEFKIAHISDLHFSAGTDPAVQHRYSIERLCGIEAHLSGESFDRLIVSGDLSDSGDFTSLSNAHRWLTDHLTLGNGRTTGLRITDRQKLIIVPGNHDAFNGAGDVGFRKRWQSSLVNFNTVFHAHVLPSPVGLGYDWLERDGEGVYVAYVDSCFLGDPGGGHDPFSTVQRVAKGRMSHNQSHELLENYDRGMRGLLRDPWTGKPIETSKFARALKIVVMHHYLFPPPGRRLRAHEYLMEIHHREGVFKNLAMADFDLLLCGHSHIADVHLTSYGREFDRRAKRRYMLNCFRRSVGIHSLPVQFVAARGVRVSKKVSAFFGILLRKARSSEQNYLDEFQSLLQHALREPRSLEQDVVAFLREHREDREPDPTPYEMEELRKRIAISIRVEDLPHLEEEARWIGEEVKAMASRPFLQVMNGSASKSTSEEKKRSFNIYSVRKVARGWQFQSDEYDWNSGQKAFGPGLRRDHFFPTSQLAERYGSA